MPGGTCAGVAPCSCHLIPWPVQCPAYSPLPDSAETLPVANLQGVLGCPHSPWLSPISWSLCSFLKLIPTSRLRLAALKGAPPCHSATPHPSAVRHRTTPHSMFVSLTWGCLSLWRDLLQPGDLTQALEGPSRGTHEQKKLSEVALRSETG